MDEKARKTALRKIPHGLFVVGVKKGDTLSAFTGTWLTQMSFTPPLVVLGVRGDSFAHECIEGDKVFTVNVLAKDQSEIAKQFFKPHNAEAGKIGSYAISPGRNGAPVLDDATAFFECRVVDQVKRGDHTVFVAEVTHAEVRRDVPALLLADTPWQYGG